MSTHARAPRRDQYTVGWICAIPEERAAANAMLDETYENTPDQDPYDTNHYSFGRVNKHNVVIAILPAGAYGISPAATVANQMSRSYTSIKIRLLVGIGGGVPTPDHDIRLGDVVVSQPKDRFGGVVQYDRGKKTAGGMFERTGQLNKPPPPLLNALASLQADFELRDFDLGKYLRENLKNQQRMLDKYCRPHEKDDLYQAKYDHVEVSSRECIRCDRRQLVLRYDRPPNEVKFHYGTIASGNLVMKNGTERDKISKDLGGILCFEMEAAGLMDDFQCLVIRGICDYADSHKNKGWQRYAALTAAAYAKKLLSIIPGTEQPAGQQYGHPLDGLLTRFAEMPAQPRSSPFNPYTSGLGQPMEQSRGLPSDQLPSSFFNPYDPYTTPPRSHQPSPQPRGSPFNQSTSGYSHSSSSRTGRSSAYPSAATDQGSFEGSSTTLARPSPTPNRTGQSDSNRTRFRADSTASGDTGKTAVDPQLGGSTGYLQSTQMTYPQLPRPSHLDRSRQSSSSRSNPSIPLRPLPPSKSGQAQPKAPTAQASQRSGQPSHGHSAPAIAPHRLPPPKTEQPQARAHGAHGAHGPASGVREPTAAGPTDSGTSKSLNVSHQGRGHATAREQVAPKPPSKAQSDQNRVQAQSPLKNDHQTVSSSKHPNPTASARGENSHGKTAEAPAQNHGEHRHRKETNPSTNGGQQQRPHHDNPKPSSKKDPHDDHSLKPKPSLERHKPSGHNRDYPGPGSVLEYTFEYGNDETSSNTADDSNESDIILEYNQESNFIFNFNNDNNNNNDEESHNHHHTEPLNGQGIPAEGQIDPSYRQEPSLYGQGYPSSGQESHGPSPYNHLRHAPYSQDYPPNRPGPSPSDSWGYPLDGQEHHGLGHEQSRDHPIYGQEHPPSDQQYSSPYDNYYPMENGTDRAVHGEAGEYFSPQDMGEREYANHTDRPVHGEAGEYFSARDMGEREDANHTDRPVHGEADEYFSPQDMGEREDANQAMAASFPDGSTTYSRPADVGVQQDEDDSSSDGKRDDSRDEGSIEKESARTVGDFEGDDEADGGCCDCFGGWCGGDKEETDDGCCGCFGGCCGGGEAKSDDGEGSCACVIM
ncbi:MAG: hypothetical protein Q9211_002836 [Gyalolechia sp. 1 TL-2023]